MTKRLLFLIPSLISICIAVVAADSMPIIAYMGVPNDKSSEANFKTFKACGFDVSLYGYNSLSQLVNACRIADKCGIKIMGHCPETHNTPEKAARVLKNEKGFFGYVIQDEPSGTMLKDLQKEISKLKRIDNTHCFYINLFPYWSDWILTRTHTKTYEEYINIASSTDCQQISFDHYPVTHKGIRSNWYYNLEMIRKESLRANKPFWGFILSVPHYEYPQPTLASLRLQAYVNLAYGAQALQYFTYWTPKPDKEYDYHNGPISNSGEKTKTYNLVQKMNKELRPIADLFYKATVTSVNHLSSIPTGTTELKRVPKNVYSIKVIGKKGAVVSQFKKNGQLYLAIVNKDHLKSMKLYISARKNVVRMLKNMKEEILKNEYNIEAGDIIIFRLT